ncbi:MAG: hypothetical protein OEV74_16300, partial [Cyclobacteriaceae bacterium]|nr:hypothetical protein [Cyclobacteriaceae bacterium]
EFLIIKEEVFLLRVSIPMEKRGPTVWLGEFMLSPAVPFSCLLSHPPHFLSFAHDRQNDQWMNLE